MAEEQGIPFSREIYQKLLGLKRMDALQVLLKKAERPYSPGEKLALATRKNDLFHEEIAAAGEDIVLPGVRETLKRLREMAIRTAVATSSENARSILKRVKIDGLFDAMADGSQISRGMPDPEAFLTASRMLHCQPQACVAVEDGKAGVEAARRCGMKVLALGPAAQGLESDWHADALNHIDLPRLIAEEQIESMEKRCREPGCGESTRGGISC